MHEFAHLLIAKRCGCGVDIFSIGFGKPFYRKEYNGTIYQITPWLLGGYCKLRDELTLSSDEAAFPNLIYRKKLFIALVGVIVNILVGIMVFLIGQFINSSVLIYFGELSFILGATNAIPFPALDGSYPILVWLEKFMGKEKGYQMMAYICRLGFIFLIALQIACIPLIILMYTRGGF
jgi:membrane-associated protease RseP (regulator of RpoE activity)